METDLAKLQGCWKIVALEVEGAKMAEEVFSGSRIVVEGNDFDTISMGASYKGTLSVDEGSPLRQLDLRFSEGPHQGQISHAIYQLDGDTWKLCLGFAGRERPSAFVTTPGSGHALEILEREAKVDLAGGTAT